MKVRKRVVEMNFHKNLFTFLPQVINSLPEVSWVLVLGSKIFTSQNQNPSITSQNQNPRDFWKTVNDLREKGKHIETGVNPKELLAHFQNLNTKGGSEQNEPPNASRVCHTRP